MSVTSCKQASKHFTAQQSAKLINFLQLTQMKVMISILACRIYDSAVSLESCVVSLWLLPTMTFKHTHSLAQTRIETRVCTYILRALALCTVNTTANDSYIISARNSACRQVEVRWFRMLCWWWWWCYVLHTTVNRLWLSV